MENLQLHTSMTNSFSGFSKPIEEARYVVIGVPYDNTSTYRSGSRFGPRAIREASLNIETYSLRTGVDIENVPMHDAGDLHVVNDVSETLDRVTKVTRNVAAAKKVPIALGGEHTITLGSIRSLPSSVGVVSFDAHGDLRDEYGGGKLSHATVLRRVSEIVDPSAIFVCGVRALCAEEEEFMRKNHVQHVTPWQLREEGLGKAVKQVRAFARKFPSTYLTLDMDVLDPAYAPGVANPEFEGLSPSELVSLVSAVASKRLIGFDVVEVCPNYDTGAAAVAAARLIFEIIAQTEKARSL